MTTFFIVAYCWFAILFQQDQMATLYIKVDGNSYEGKPVLVALYNQYDEFLSDESFKNTSALLKAGQNTLRIDKVPMGVYAVSLFVDINENGALDTNWMGIPKEPYAFSNNAKGKFGPPEFKDARFLIDQKEVNISITIK